MKKKTSPLETLFVAILFIGLSFTIIFSSNLEKNLVVETGNSIGAPDDGSTIASGGINGFAVRGFDDYERYKSKMSEEAYDALTSSLFYEKKQYIISANDYERIKEKAATILSAEDRRDLPIINAVAVNAKRSELLSIMESEGINVEQVYLDMEAELLRSQTLETLNITNIRIYGPVAYNMTARGVRIGLIDSGVDSTHSEFNCTIGAAGCFIKRSVDATDDYVTTVNRTKTLETFNDGSWSKAIDLSSDQKSAKIIVMKDSTFQNASVRLSSSATLSIGSTTVGTGTQLDFTDALTSETCESVDNFMCEYTLTFTGTGNLIASGLSVNYSYSSIIPTTEGKDTVDHGTFITGILHKTAPDAEVYSYKVTTDKWGYTRALVSDIISGIQYAVDDNVDVITMSLGVPTNGDPCINPPFYNAIQKAYEKGIVVVAAAGNDYGDTVNMPACFDNTVAISAINRDKTPSAFSSKGPEVDFAMPGATISSTGLNNSIVTKSGTSFSAPFATAEFAMMKEAADSLGLKLKPWQYLELGKDSAEDIGNNGRDDKTGYGMLRISKIMHSLYNETKIFSSSNSIDFSNGSLSNSVEIWTNKNSPLLTQVLSDGFDINGTTVDVVASELGNNNTLTINRSSTILLSIDATSSMLSLLSPGHYTSNLLVVEQANESELAEYSECTSQCREDSTDATTTCNFVFDECMGLCYGDFYCQEDCRHAFTSCNGNITNNLNTCTDNCSTNIFQNRDFALLSIPITLDITDSEAASSEESDVTLGIFAAEDSFYSLFEQEFFDDGNFFGNSIANFSSNEDLYNNLSEPTKDYISFFAKDSDRNYYADVKNYTETRSNSNKFNLNQLFLPIIKVQTTDSASFNKSYFMTILSPDKKEKTLFSTSAINNELTDDNRSGKFNTTYFTFTADGGAPESRSSIGLELGLESGLESESGLQTGLPLNAQIRNDAELQSILSNMYAFKSAGIYEYKIYESSQDLSDNNLVVQGSVEVLSNLSFILRTGYIFIGDENQVDFDIVDNRHRFVSRFIGTENYDTTFSYSNIFLVTMVNGSARIGQKTYNISFTSDLDGEHATLKLDRNLTNESSASVLFSFNQDNNTALKTETMSIIYPVNLSVKSTYPTVALNKNMSINVSASKNGTYTGNVDVTFEFNDTNCSNSINVEGNNLNFSVAAGTNTSRSAKISLKNSSFATPRVCYMNVVSTVSGLCLACTDHNDYPYTETEQVQFNITDYASTVGLNSYINETKIVNGESVMVYLNITNIGLMRYTGTLYTNLTNNSQTEQSLAIDLAVGESTLKGFSYIIRGTGTKTFNARAVGVSSTEYSSLDLVASSDALSVSSISTGGAHHINETVPVIVTVSNNNDEPETAEARISLTNNLETTDSIETANISANSNARLTFNVKINSDGSNLISGTVIGTQFTTFFNTTISVLAGTSIRVNITDRAKRYKIGTDDTLLFSIDDNCEDTYDDCGKACDSNESRCKDVCKTEYDGHRRDYDTCKEKCNSYTDSSDAKDCRSDCKDQIDEFKVDFEDCKSDCTDDLNDCNDECTDDRATCLDDRVEIDLKADEVNENDITLTGSDFDIFIRENDSKKMDFNDDGFYETLMRLSKIVENATNPCEDACSNTYDTTEAACKLAEDSCKSRCDTDSDCKRDCTNERSDCINDAKDDKNSCNDDCDPVITGYELELLSIKKEEVPLSNYTKPKYNYTYNVTTPNTNATHIQTCTDDSKLCKDSLTCIRAGWFWYENICHTEKLPVVNPPTPDKPPVEEIPTEPPTPETTEIPDVTTEPRSEPTDTPTDEPAPQVDKPTPASSGSKNKLIVIAIICITIIGVIVSGYMFMKNTHEVAGVEETNGERSAKIKDYFVKQLERGYNMQQINDALIKLGWQKNLVDEVSKGLALDRRTMDMIRVYRYAKEYGINDQLALRRKFSELSPETIMKAVEELNRRMIGK